MVERLVEVLGGFFAFVAIMVLVSSFKYVNSEKFLEDVRKANEEDP